MVFAFAGDSTITRAFAITCFQEMIPNYQPEVTTLSQRSFPEAAVPGPAFRVQKGPQLARTLMYPAQFPGDHPNLYRGVHFEGVQRPPDNGPELGPRFSNNDAGSAR